jgi:REP element-mobilizing transposase RayT
MIWNHWVIRASTPFEPFKSFEGGQYAWQQLQKIFPEMISAVLMPNHVHLILPITSNEVTHQKLSGFMGALSKKTGHKILWQKVPSPVSIPDRHHLRRQLRYVALNPCRKGLCRDPLEWYWSTYREIMGATVVRNQSFVEIAKILGEPKQDFRVRFHAYVSGDPSVSISGTPLPKRSLPKDIPEQSIGEILSAAAAALRVSRTELLHRTPLRRLFIHAAVRHGWKQNKILAHLCGTSLTSIQKHRRLPFPPGVDAVDLCLGDKRLVQTSKL